MSKDGKEIKKNKGITKKTAKAGLESTIKYNEITAPFYTTNNFDITYSFVDRYKIERRFAIDGNDIHASLKAASDGYRKKYKKLHSKDEDANKKMEKLKKANLLNGEIGFIYSKDFAKKNSIEKMRFRHFPIRVPHKEPQYTYCVSDIKDNSNLNYSDGILEKFKLAKQHAPKVKLKVQPPGKIEKYYGNDEFFKKYHHTEQACMHFLESSKGTKFVVKKILKAEPVFVYALFLDLHSTRYVCNPCNVGLIGLQNSQEQGWLNRLQTELNKKGVKFPKKGLTLNTRISADDNNYQQHLKTDKDPKERPHVTWKDRSLILQGDSGNPKGKLKDIIKGIIEDKEYSIDTFSGDTYSSRKIETEKIDKRLHKRKCFSR